MTEAWTHNKSFMALNKACWWKHRLCPAWNNCTVQHLGGQQLLPSSWMLLVTAHPMSLFLTLVCR